MRKCYLRVTTEQLHRLFSFGVTLEYSNTMSYIVGLFVYADGVRPSQHLVSHLGSLSFFVD